MVTARSSCPADTGTKLRKGKAGSKKGSLGRAGAGRLRSSGDRGSRL